VPHGSRPSDWPSPIYDHPLPQRLHDIGAGRIQLPPSAARRHHYVPQFILRGFECRDLPKHLVHLDKRTGRPRQVPIASAGWEEHLYGAKSEAGEYDNRIEAFLGLIEGYAAPALTQLLEGTATASEDESMPIALLLGLQLGRTPSALTEIGDLAEKLGQEQFELLVSDPTAFARMVSQARDQQLGVEDLESYRQDVLKAIRNGMHLRVSPKRYVGLDLMVSGFVEAGLAMSHADWVILHADDASFITNDCGYARVSPVDGLPIESGIAFPIRSNVCLVVTPPTSDGTQVFRRRASTAQTALINLRIYGWGERFIFGCTQQTVTSVRAAARKDKRRSRPPTPTERLPGPP